MLDRLCYYALMALPFRVWSWPPMQALILPRAGSFAFRDDAGADLSTDGEPPF